MEEESAGWSVGAVVIVVLIALFVVIFIVILVSKGKWCTGSAPPPPPCEEPPPPCEPYVNLVPPGVPVIPQSELISYVAPRVDPFAVSIADPTHPRATASILSLGTDGSLSNLAFGFLKPDENAGSVVIGAAAVDESSLYIYVVNKTMSGVYSYRLDGSPSQKWIYWVSTGSSRYEAAHDLRGKLDTERANSVYSIYLEEGQLRLVTLAGVVYVTGKAVTGTTFLLRSGNYGLTATGELLEGDYPIRTPEGVTIEPNDPQQIVSFPQPYSRHRYGYICRRQGQPGVVLIGEARSWFVPVQAEQFALVGDFLVYLGADKQLYRQNLMAGLGATVQRLELPGTPSHVLMVDNLVFVSY